MQEWLWGATAATEAAGGPGESLQACPRTPWPLTAECLRPGAEGGRRSISHCVEQKSLLVVKEETAVHCVAMTDGKEVVTVRKGWMEFFFSATQGHYGSLVNVWELVDSCAEKSRWSTRSNSKSQSVTHTGRIGRMLLTTRIFFAALTAIQTGWSRVPHQQADERQRRT